MRMLGHELLTAARACPEDALLHKAQHSIVVRSVLQMMHASQSAVSQGFDPLCFRSQVFGKARVAQKHMAAGSNSMTPADSERWLRLLHSLQLGPVQREHLLTLRMRQLAKLAKLMDARRFLSMQVDMA